MQAGAHADQPLVVHFQEFLVDAGPVVKSFQVAGGGEFHEVLVALHALHQDQEVPRRLPGAPGGLVETAPRRDIQFAADDGLDTLLVGLLVKADGSEHIAVIGHGNGGHLVLLYFFEQIVQANGSIEEAVLGVNVEVDEIGMLHRVNPASSWALPW